MLGRVRAAMCFTPSPEAAGAWWSEALGAELHREVEGDSVYTWVDVDGMEFGFHMLDEQRNPQDGSPCQVMDLFGVVIGLDGP
ncbi:hypothetical protein ACFWPU_30450 [Streptomyces sp. NPDC058471]|uniref:hypothetical protein n=1 Tax=Streptomyces sp. NPDC058471 TaxID=3346516 RepID=UPI003652CEBE